MNRLKNPRLTICKKNKNWNNVVFTDWSSIYFHSPEVCRWVPKGENNIVLKEKYSKTCIYDGNIEAWWQSAKSFLRKHRYSEKC